jgi:hypothetical protein
MSTTEEYDGPTIGGEPVRVERWPTRAEMADRERRELEHELDMLAHDLGVWQREDPGVLDLREEHAPSVLGAARGLRGFLARQGFDAIARAEGRDHA